MQTYGTHMAHLSSRSTMLSRGKVSSPALTALTITSLFALAATLSFFLADDYRLALFLYVVFLITGIVFAAVFYYREVVTFLNKYFPNGVPDKARLAGFDKREEAHKAIQETSGRFAEVAAAFGVVLFAVGVIKPYSESLRATHSQAVRAAYDLLMDEAGSIYVDLCFKSNVAQPVGSAPPAEWCEFLSKLDPADAERAPLTTMLEAQAKSVASAANVGPEAAASLMRLAQTAERIESSPSVRESRKILRSISQPSSLPSWFRWFPLVGGFAIGLGAALKIGRAFVDKSSLRRGASEKSTSLDKSTAAAISAVNLQTTAPAPSAIMNASTCNTTWQTPTINRHGVSPLLLSVGFAVGAAAVYILSGKRKHTKSPRDVVDRKSGSTH